MSPLGPQVYHVLYLVRYDDCYHEPECICCHRFYASTSPEAVALMLETLCEQADEIGVAYDTFIKQELM